MSLLFFFFLGGGGYIEDVTCPSQKGLKRSIRLKKTAECKHKEFHFHSSFMSFTLLIFNLCFMHQNMYHEAHLHCPIVFMDTIHCFCELRHIFLRTRIPNVCHVKNICSNYLCISHTYSI